MYEFLLCQATVEVLIQTFSPFIGCIIKSKNFHYRREPPFAAKTAILPPIFLPFLAELDISELFFLKIKN